MIEIITIVTGTIIMLGVGIIIDRTTQNYKTWERILIILSCLTLQALLCLLIYTLLTLIPI